MAASGILDLRSHFGLERPQVEVVEEEDDEPLHPLDLRICKVNESISRNNHASGDSVFNNALRNSKRDELAEVTKAVSVTPSTPTTMESLRLRSPMQSAFPGQIPPDRRYSEAPRSPTLPPQGQTSVHQYDEQSPLGLTLRPLNELQAKVQQQMQQHQPTHRYHPYASDFKHIRSAGGVGEHRPSKSAFLRHVLQNRDVSSHHPQKFGYQPHGIPKAEPVDHAIEIDRRMEALDQRLRLHEPGLGHLKGGNSGYYSPPDSPVMGNNPCLPPPLCFDPEMAVRRHRDFLRKLQEGHFFGNAAAAAAAAAAAGNYFGQSPLSPPDEADYCSVNRSPPPLEPLSPLAEDSLEHGGHPKGKRGRPRKHAIKIPLPPLYVFIRNLLHNRFYNPRVVSWVCEYQVKEGGLCHFKM